MMLYFVKLWHTKAKEDTGELVWLPRWPKATLSLLEHGSFHNAMPSECSNSSIFSPVVLKVNPEIQPETSTVLVTTTLQIKQYSMTKCQVVHGLPRKPQNPGKMSIFCYFFHWQVSLDVRETSSYIVRFSAVEAQSSETQLSGTRARAFSVQCPYL